MRCSGRPDQLLAPSDPPGPRTDHGDGTGTRVPTLRREPLWCRRSADEHSASRYRAARRDARRGEWTGSAGPEGTGKSPGDQRAREGQARPRPAPGSRLMRARHARLAVLVAALAAAACGKGGDKPAGPRDAVIAAWKADKLTPSAMTPAKVAFGVDCQSGTVESLDALVCSFGSPAEAKAAEDQGLS